MLHLQCCYRPICFILARNINSEAIFIQMEYHDLEKLTIDMQTSFKLREFHNSFKVTIRGLQVLAMDGCMVGDITPSLMPVIL